MSGPAKIKRRNRMKRVKRKVMTLEVETDATNRDIKRHFGRGDIVQVNEQIQMTIIQVHVNEVKK